MDAIFTDVQQPVNPETVFIQDFMRHTNYKGFELWGGGSKWIRLSEEWLWAGSESFATAPFSVDLDGNLVGAWAKFKTWDITISGTGALSITWLWFKPKLLTIYASNGSATPRVVQSIGVSDKIRTFTQYIWEDTTAPNYVSDMSQNSTGALIIYLYRNWGANFQRADLTSFDTDGFTLNVVSNTMGGTSKYSYVAQG